MRIATGTTEVGAYAEPNFALARAHDPGCVLLLDKQASFEGLMRRLPQLELQLHGIVAWPEQECGKKAKAGEDRCVNERVSRKDSM